MLSERSFARSHAIFRAAHDVLPGGVPAGGTPLLSNGKAPLYFERGSGCHIWDVDGNEYVDYILAYGAVLLGYANPEVDAAASREVANGMLLSMNHPLHGRFLEAVLRRFPAADMGYFMKTGSEATTAAVRLARRYTGRRKIVRCGFHGWHDWCFPDDGSTPAGIAEQVLPLHDITAHGLERLLSQNIDQIAAVIVAPEMVMPLDREAINSLIETAHAHGALFILDEIKTGFRTLSGSVQTYLNVHPDITTLSKALGNGWPVSTVIGRKEIMQAGQGIHLSATYHGDTTGMAAALANLAVLDRENVASHVWQLGTRLIDGLNVIAKRHRVPARAYGEPVPSMPFMAFIHADQDINNKLIDAFYTRMFQLGVLLHPRHLWYISFAHTEGDIDTTLACADRAMSETRAAVL